jgi:Ca2+/Na+ antiporter
VIRPGAVEDSVLHLDFPFMIGVAALFWVLARVVPPTFRLNRWQGGVLFAAYFVYLGLLYVLGNPSP